MYPNPYEQNPYDQRQAGSGGNTNPPQNPQNPPQNPPSGPNPYGPSYPQTAYGNQGQYTPPPPPPSPSNPQWDSTVRADDPSQYPAVPANPNQYQQTVPSQYPQGTPGQYVQPGANQYAAPTMPNQFTPNQYQPTPAPANQYQGGTFNQPPTPTKRPSSNMRLILIGLVAVLVIGGGLATFFGISAHNTQVAHDNATATANVQATGTSIANTQATGTAVAQANASATANAQASATAVASVYPFSATVKLDDPLTDNSKNVAWKTSNNCQFTGGAYHVIVPDAKTFIDCYASNTNYTDFTYQVTMQILKGDFGGITIRGDSPNFKYYAFAISADGAYAIELYTSAANPTELDSGTIANFQVNAANTVGVVARGSSLTLYVNNQQAASVTDNTYTGGQIGCIGYNIQNYADVAFSNAKVWGLTQTQ